jgi:phage shock protein PspC (stress-responsive transcriptional regulator)
VFSGKTPSFRLARGLLLGFALIGAGSVRTYIDGMNELEIPHESEESSPPESELPPRDTSTLRRSTTKRIFGGVAGGLSERFDIDANIVRVIFVVLALVWGLGIALYLAMWVLIPREPSSGAVVNESLEDPPRVRWLRYALPLSLVVIAVIFISTIRVVPTLGKAFSLLWLVFLVVLAVVALFSPARRLTFRRFVALAFLGVISFFIVLSGAVLLTLQVIGVPVQGGSGARQWAPTTTSEIQHVYHGAYGAMNIDLSHVAFRGTTTVTATEGIGKLLVEVPAGVTVDLRTHVGIGNVENYETGLDPSSSVAHQSGANLVLNLSVGIGQIQLVHIVGNQP